MPYILSPPVNLNSNGMWGGGQSYARENIYAIENDKMPPVNYDAHTLKPHSITHAESSLHVLEAGHSMDFYFRDSTYFYGATTSPSYRYCN